MTFVPTSTSLFFGRGDKTDPRLGELVKPATLDTLAPLTAPLTTGKSGPRGTLDRKFAILGYPDDDGIALNGGRPGAKDAPPRIRHYLYKMTPPPMLASHVQDLEHGLEIHDFGDLKCTSPSDANTLAGELEKRHQLARDAVTRLFKSGFKSITLGGGHDYGFPDAAAFCATCPAGSRPLVINFDAHLDVRPTDKGFHSGTPFYRLLSEFPEIDFLEIGLQSQCNSATHLKWALERGALVSFQEDRMASGESLTKVLHRFLGESALRARPTFLSIDIDGFSSAVAPGASQVWPTGFSAEEFFDAFSWCLHRLDVRGIGIYEVSPKFDVDDRTSRLAALIAHRFMFQL